MMNLDEINQMRNMFKEEGIKMCSVSPNAFILSSKIARHILFIFKRRMDLNNTQEEVITVLDLNKISGYNLQSLYQAISRLDTMGIVRYIRTKPYKVLVNYITSKKWIDYAIDIEQDKVESNRQTSA